LAIARSESGNATSQALVNAEEAVAAVDDKFDALDAKLVALAAKVEDLAAKVEAHQQLADSPTSLIPNRGTPGASSVYSTYYARKGFSTSELSWASNSGAQYFPASVWMRYSRSHRLAKIGFRTAPSTSEMSKGFEVIGSNDCTNWNTLLYVENAGFTKGLQFKTFQIPLENRIAFSCLGLKFQNTPVNLVRLGQITMWEQT